MEEFLNEFVKGFREYFSDFRKRVRNYSPESLLSFGRELVDDSRYLEAKVVFDELSKTRGITRDISEIYGILILSIVVLNHRSKKHNPLLVDKTVINKAIYSMIESTAMHSERKLSNFDLSEIELLIDRIPFQKMTIPDREEFEKIYYGFKNYTLDVFLGKR